jgi:hypothetical protein
MIKLPKHLGKSWSGEFYPNSLKEHIHALGVVAANYNSLESTFYSIFCEYFGISDGSAALFAQFKNNFRIDTLKVIVSKYETDPKVADAVFHFLKCFTICADNRNILMHSLMDSFHQGETILKIRKSARNDFEKYTDLQFDLTSIRDTADEIWMVEGYAIDLYFYFLTRRGDPDVDERDRQKELPAKLVLSSNLTLLLQQAGRSIAGQP